MRAAMSSRPNMARLLPATKAKLRAAGEEIVLLMGGGTGDLRPKATVALAAEAFQDAVKPRAGRKS